MPRPHKDTETLKLRPERELVEKVQRLVPFSGYKTHNQLCLALIEWGLDLVESPLSCPPLPLDLMRLRKALHGNGGGTYADETASPGPRLAEDPPQTVVEKMSSDAAMLKALDMIAALIAMKNPDPDPTLKNPEP